MKNLGLAAISSVALIAGGLAPAFAQGIPAPINEAQTRVACGGGTIVSAERLPSGAVRVTCRREGSSDTANNTGGSATGAIVGTGLASSPALGAVLLVGLAAIGGGGGNPAVPTTTTSTTTATTTTTTTTTTGSR